MLRRLLRYFLFGSLTLAVLTALLGMLWEYVPYQGVATSKLRAALAVYGLDVRGMQVTRLTSSEAEITQLQIGDAPGLRVARIHAWFDMDQLMRGQLKKLEIEGLMLDAYRARGQWTISGLEPLLTAKASSSGPGADPATLRLLVPETKIIYSTLTVHDGKWQAKLPIELSIANTPEGPRGTLRITPLESTGLASLPTLTVAGDFLLGQRNLALHFTATDSANPPSLQADATIKAPLHNPKAGTLSLSKLSMPWKGGRLWLEPVTVPLLLNKPIAVTGHAENLPLEGLLDQVSQGKVKGTGRITGALPLTWYPDGKFALRDGAAEGQEPGTLIVSPDTLPDASRKEMAAVRAALQNFHYTSLKIGVSSTADEKSALHLLMEGRSPDAFNGKPVKLNVNITGDLLPLIRQSLMPLEDARTLLNAKEP